MIRIKIRKYNILVAVVSNSREIRDPRQPCRDPFLVASCSPSASTLHWSRPTPEFHLESFRLSGHLVIVSRY